MLGIFLQDFFFYIGNISARFSISGIFLQDFPCRGCFCTIFHVEKYLNKIFPFRNVSQDVHCRAGMFQKDCFHVSDVSARFSVLKLLFTRNPFGLVETHVCSELSFFRRQSRDHFVSLSPLAVSFCTRLQLATSVVVCLCVCTVVYVLVLPKVAARTNSRSQVF